MSKAVVAALITLGLACPAWAQSPPAKVVLITEAEASLPSMPDTALTMRAGVTRGPKIMLISPTANASLKSPFRLQLKFETFGGAKIDPESVKVTYLKNPSVDLTTRVAPLTQGNGIDVAAAEVPPGTHHIRVNVKDSEGRAGSANFALKVAP
ncbi:MAG: hypothetical protein IT537_02145 [Hyphomicrobiales bacterium]|nr:hypothetical protein [Hyphomicrobiales bacterium]